MKKLSIFSILILFAGFWTITKAQAPEAFEYEQYTLDLSKAELDNAQLVDAKKNSLVFERIDNTQRAEIEFAVQEIPFAGRKYEGRNKFSCNFNVLYHPKGFLDNYDVQFYYALSSDGKNFSEWKPQGPDCLGPAPHIEYGVLGAQYLDGTEQFVKYKAVFEKSKSIQIEGIDLLFILSPPVDKALIKEGEERLSQKSADLDYCNEHYNVSRNSWGSSCGTTTTMCSGGTPATTTATHIFVHHQGAGALPTNYSQALTLLNSVENQHVNVNGWSDIGYNVVVDPSTGSVFQGRAGGIDVRGAHVCALNTATYGICLLGDYTSSTLSSTAKGVDALQRAVAAKAVQAGINTTQVSTHLSGTGNASSLNNVSGHKDRCAGYSCPGTIQSNLPNIRTGADTFVNNCNGSGGGGCKKMDDGMFFLGVDLTRQLLMHIQKEELYQNISSVQKLYIDYANELFEHQSELKNAMKNARNSLETQFLSGKDHLVTTDDLEGFCLFFDQLKAIKDMNPEDRKLAHELQNALHVMLGKNFEQALADFDETELSSVEKVKVCAADNTKIEAFYNKQSKTLTLNLFSEDAKNIKLAVYDLSGRYYSLPQHLELNSGWQTLEVPVEAHKNAGIGIISLSFDSERAPKAHKVLIQ